MNGEFVLPGGTHCELLSPHMPGVANYHVLAATGPVRNEDDTVELARLGAAIARDLGSTLMGDEGAFTIILNGPRTSRRPWAHVHIIPTDTPGRKRRAFACLMLKKPLRAADRAARRIRRYSWRSRAVPS